MQLDNPIRFSEVEVRAAFRNVDETVAECVMAGDPRKAIELGKSIVKDGALRGLALARLLYELQEKWPQFVAAGIEDDFYAVIETEMGYRPATVDKYARMWEAVFENPKIENEVKYTLMGRPMQDLLLLTAAARENSLSEEQMREAAASPDRNSLREIIQVARGRQTSSKAAITITISLRDGSRHPAGTLYAKRGDEREELGILYVNSESELAQAAIARILQATGIVEVH